MKNVLSITSNEVKLFKHMDNLQTLQDGQASPVMLHISPTNLCNLNCKHCCFSGRDRTQSLDLQIIKSAVHSFGKLGLKSLELTGGGEPTLYPQMNELIDWLKDTHWPVGMNTNALSIQNVSDWSVFCWVRVSFNILDSEKDKQKFIQNVKTIQDSGVSISACYIVSNDFSRKSIEEILRFSETEKISTRLAPNCIQTKANIAKLTQRIKNEFGKDIDKSEFLFLSDFNVYLEDRPNNSCSLHLLKPFLYTDGWIYSCPSSELSFENNRTMQHKFRICKWNQIDEFYSLPPKPKQHSCHYCKYAKHNILLDAIMKETEDNDFC